MATLQSLKTPTDAECNILASIWQLEKATVRQVHDHLSQSRTIGYTTVLKFMQIMVEKGLLRRDTTVRPQIFCAANPQEQTQQGMLRSLLQKAFDGSLGALVLQALSMQKSTPEEICEIRNRLDELEAGKR